ncbi:MAG TPA: ATP-binding protein [Gammaproteobacteria bacterium]|nr:ATP-binding protein [Gammaproteobacteria bacterium]
MSSVIPARSASDGTEPIGILRLLFWLRAFAIVAQCAAVWVAHYVLAAPLPIRPIVLTVGALALWNVLGYRDLFSNRRVQHGEVALHLVVDVAAFTSMIYFTGGYTNPFVSLYLLPISLAAASLPAAYAWSIGAICGVCYSLVWRWHVPLPPVDARFGSDFDLHVAGMWVNFLIAAILIVFFVGRMARVLRWRDQELAALHETALRDQQIVELGTLAAGTAHELNTPLSTLAILVEELNDSSTTPAQREHLKVMAEQIQSINERLNRIARDVGAARSEGARQVGLREYVEALIDEWRGAHPEIELAVTFDLPADDMRIVAEATIDQVIRNVLDNAAYATLENGRDHVAVRVSCRDGRLDIAVTDEGTGLDPNLREIGLRVVSTKDRGLGIGILLSRAALERFGGRLELANRPTGGVEAQIHLPLDELIAGAR